MENKAMFKGKDLGFLREVTDFLNNYGLKAELEGEAKECFYNGNMRRYKDINLIVENRSIRLNTESFHKYCEVIQKLYKIADKKDTYKDWKIEDNAMEFEMNRGYIDHRFRITNPKINTSIDLSFGVHDKNNLEYFII
ncbi:MAG: hypothetical protein WC915_06420 [archaeon]